MSLFIANADVFTDGKLQKKNILVADGKIKGITDEKAITTSRFIDAAGKIILPGLIDSHVHFREPGLTHKEDFFTGSCAAAAGGVTTIIDMPNTIPPTTTIDLLTEKRELAKKSIVNYGFHFGSTVEDMNEIRKLKDSDAASVKVYMDATTGNLLINNDEALNFIFTNYKMITCHAEAENVLKAINLIKETKNKLYLCHISTENELNILKKNKIKNKVFVEVTPHHLFLSEEDDKNSFFKMKPTLKSKKDQEALWLAIEKNKVDTIGSDHATHTIEEKQKENFPHGVPGVETMLPLLFNAVLNKKLKMEKLVQLCCENPAKIFQIRNKGFIKEGYDADLVVVDPMLEKEVSNEDLFTKCKWSPFNGWKLKGWPVMTIVNGDVVFENGKINDIKANEISYIVKNPFKKEGGEIESEETDEGAIENEGIQPEEVQ
ncbi:MAG: dihydroorotase family protein [Candidatus Woesearchaeota archaeon]|nr:dihydroorotase family protein [Candidatus Woesearchaeota archaeon]